MAQRSSCLPACLAAVILLSGAYSVEAQVARVNGVVRDVNGSPLRGAIVTAEPGSGSVTATTDDNGRFALLAMRSGLWRFEVQAPGYHTETGEMTVRAGLQNRPLTIALRRAGFVGTGPLARIPGEDVQAQLATAAGYFDAGQWDQAIAAYRALLSRAPSLTAIHFQIAAAHRSRGDHDAAIAAYEAVLKADPANQVALVGISATNRDRGDAHAAEQVLLAAASAPMPGAAVLVALGELQAEQGRARDAAASFQRAAAADPGWGRPLYRLGELAISAGDRPEAARYLNEVIAVDPVSPEAELAETALQRLNSN